MYVPGSDEDTAEYKQSRGALVEQFESPVVNTDGVNLDKTLGDTRHSSDDLSHQVPVPLTPRHALIS